MNYQEINDYLDGKIQGGFGSVEAKVFEEEFEKLEAGSVYLEIGVDEGRSFYFASIYAKRGVFLIGIDIHNVDPHQKSIGRGKFMEQEGLVGLGKRGFFIHGDADELVNAVHIKVDLLFIDGHHDYESVKKNYMSWFPFVRKGGVILFHDYDHPDVKRFLDEKFEDNKQVIGGKIVKIEVST